MSGRFRAHAQLDEFSQFEICERSVSGCLNEILPLCCRRMEEPARCLGCGYILEQLPEPRCPECGRDFDLQNPSTFTRKPLYVAWDYWLPSLCFAVGAGALLYFMVLHTSQSVGASLTICLPFAVGSVFGYSHRIRLPGQISLGLIALGSIGILSLIAGAGGLFCIVLLFLIALGPLLVGVLGGVVLRNLLKRTRFSQKAHLPVLILLMLQPFGVAIVEHFIIYKFGNRSVETSILMPVDSKDAWNAAMFYEQVKHAPPLLLRLGLSRPLYSYGSMAKVGDIKTCVYDRGTLTKRITRVEPGKEIEFVVVQQSIERCGVILKGGSFRFEPAGPNQTRVTLTTEYEPILAPRLVWQPWEDTSIHTLHGHVLAGMLEKAQHPAE